MSHFTKLSNIKFTDLEALKKALNLLKVEDSAIQVATDKKLTAQGYGSTQIHDADVVVAGKSIGSSTDIYFKKGSDGSYQMVGDTYTLGGFCRSNEAVSGQGPGDLIAQAYSYEVTMQKLQEQGFMVDGDFVKDKEGNVTLQAVKWG
jgi:hypothetical protein